MQEELNVVQTKIKNEEAVSLDEILPDKWKTKKFNDLLLRYLHDVYNQNTRDR